MVSSVSSPNARKMRVGLIMPTVISLIFFALRPAGNAVEFQVSRVSDPTAINRDPVISGTGLAAWTYYSTISTASAYSHIALYNAPDKTTDSTSLLLFVGGAKLTLQDNQLAFVSSYLDSQSYSLQRPQPKTGASTNQASISQRNNLSAGVIRFDASTASGQGDGSSVWLWNNTTRTIDHMPAESMNNIAPSVWGDLIAWQWEQEWPFGYEIMIKRSGEIIQLTTNRFYDLGPNVYADKVTWFGWDGYDYEIFMYDSTRNETIQITSNRYDDTGPMIWNDVIVWEGYAAVEPDIFMWKDGAITKLSENLEDDLNPHIWGDKIVWQGFDGDDFEIYLYDISNGGPAIKITSNDFDDTNPSFHDDLIAWMGYHDNWDAEIYAMDLSEGSPATGFNPVRLTDNDQEDRDVDTAGRRIIWVEEQGEQTQIMLAEPR